MVYRVRPKWFKGVYINKDAPEPLPSKAKLTVYWGASETLTWQELLAVYEASRHSDHLLWFRFKKRDELIRQGFHENDFKRTSDKKDGLPSVEGYISWKKLISDIYGELPIETLSLDHQPITWEDLLNRS